MKRKNKETFFNFVFWRNAALGILLVGLIVAAGQRVWVYLKNSHLFKIKTVVVSDPGMQFIKASRLANLKGRNIFTVDLHSLTQKLQAQYPEIADIKLLKRFPDQIVVVTKKRAAFARTSIRHKEVTIDAQGIILSVGSPEVPLAAEIPWITGVNSENIRPAPGSQLKGRDIKTALALITAFRANKYLSIYKILKIDVTNLSQVEFYLTQTLKVIVDQNEISEKMQTLSLMLTQAQLKLDEINYIDLRFKEPIIGKKAENK